MQNGKPFSQGADLSLLGLGGATKRGVEGPREGATSTLCEQISDQLCIESMWDGGDRLNQRRVAAMDVWGQPPHPSVSGGPLSERAGL